MVNSWVTKLQLFSKFHDTTKHPGKEVFMTTNQIAYWNMQNQKSANEEQARHNKAQEHFNLSSLAETTRHNQATEGIDLGKLNESKRHNVVTESETHRHNVTGEQIDLGNLSETTRHNLAVENENARHNITSENENKRSNLANENLKQQSIDISNKEVDIKQQDANTRSSQAESAWAKINNDFDIAMQNLDLNQRRIRLDAIAKQIDAELRKAGMIAEADRFDQQLSESQRNNDLDYLASVLGSIIGAVGRTNNRR